MKFVTLGNLRSCSHLFPQCLKFLRLRISMYMLACLFLWSEVCEFREFRRLFMSVSTLHTCLYVCLSY